MRSWRSALGAFAMAAVLVVAAPAESSRRAAPTTDWAHALALQKDGRLVAAGLSRAPAKDAFGLVRYTTSGRLDEHFGRRGKVLTQLNSWDGAHALAIQPDGKVLAAGGTLAHGFVLARYGRNGSFDPGFGHGGAMSTDFGLGKATAGMIKSLGIQRDGKIVAAGWAGRFLKGPTYFALARYGANGKLDSGFGKGGTVLMRLGGDQATSLAIQSDGKIVVAAVKLYRFTSRGRLDASFGTGGKVAATIGIGAVAIQADGRIIGVGGGLGPSNSGDFGVVRYAADGTLDTTFGDDGTTLTNFGADPTANVEGSSEGASAVAIQADGKIVAVGSTDVRGVFCGGIHHGPKSVGNLSICDDFAIARFNVDGGIDTSFGKDGKVVTNFAARPGARESSSRAEAVAIQADGRIVVAGLANGYDFGLARYTARGRLDASFGNRGKAATDFGAG